MMMLIVDVIFFGGRLLLTVIQMVGLEQSHSTRAEFNALAIASIDIGGCCFQTLRRFSCLLIHPRPLHLFLP